MTNLFFFPLPISMFSSEFNHLPSFDIGTFRFRKSPENGINPISLKGSSSPPTPSKSQVSLPTSSKLDVSPQVADSVTPAEATLKELNEVASELESDLNRLKNANNFRANGWIPNCSPSRDTNLIRRCSNQVVTELKSPEVTAWNFLLYCYIFKITPFRLQTMMVGKIIFSTSLFVCINIRTLNLFHCTAFSLPW